MPSACRCGPGKAASTSTARRSKEPSNFSVWPLSQAAEACFGAPEWPDERPVPQMSIEFEVADADAVSAAAAELQERGFELLHGARQEPWGQTVARVQTVDSVIVGISYAPSLHD
jgi:hypothetical protein